MVTIKLNTQFKIRDCNSFWFFSLFTQTGSLQWVVIVRRYFAIFLVLFYGLLEASNQSNRTDLILLACQDQVQGFGVQPYTWVHLMMNDFWLKSVVKISTCSLSDNSTTSSINADGGFEGESFVLFAFFSLEVFFSYRATKFKLSVPITDMITTSKCSLESI